MGQTRGDHTPFSILHFCNQSRSRSGTWDSGRRATLGNTAFSTQLQATHPPTSTTSLLLSLPLKDRAHASFHKIQLNVQDKFINKKPCDSDSPQHQSSCCDRNQGKRMRIYTPLERLENGACRNWIESTCRFADLCRYAHIEICRFQDRCRSRDSCVFYHRGAYFTKSLKTFP